MAYEDIRNLKILPHLENMWAWLSKAFEVRGITMVGPNCNHKCPYKRETEGHLTYNEEKKVMWHWKEKLKQCDHKQGIMAATGWWKRQGMDASSREVFPTPWFRFINTVLNFWTSEIYIVLSHYVILICYSSHRKQIRYEQLYTHKFDSLNEMDQFLKKR